MLNKIFSLFPFSLIKSKEIRLLLFFGLIFRGLLFLFYLHSTKVPDSHAFLELGEKMLQFDLKGYNGERSPGYPFLLFLALGYSSLAIFYQFAIGIITSIYWYKTLLNFQFTPKTSLYLALFFQSFLHVFIYETSILIETVALLFVTIIFYMITNGYYEKKNLKTELVMGFLLGYLVLIKPFFAFLPFVIYGFSILKNFSFRKIINHKIIILVFPLIAYFGWSYVNKINTGYFVSTTFYGLNVAQNCVYFAEKGPKEYDWISEPYVKHREIAIRENKDVAMSIWYAYNAGEFESQNLSFADLSNELGKFGKETIRNNPKEYLYQVVFRSWIDFWKVFDMKEYMKFRISAVDEAMNAIWFVQKAILTIFKFSFLLLIPFYVFQFIRNKKISNELILVVIIFSTSVLQGIVTYGTNAKYSYPFEYMMIIIVLLFLRRYVISSKKRDTLLQ